MVLWVGAFTVSVAGFWVVPPPWSWAVTAGVLVAAGAATLVLGPGDPPPYPVEAGEAGLLLGTERVPWARITGLRADRVLSMSPVGRPSSELSALVVEVSGHPRVLPSRARPAEVARVARALDAQWRSSAGEQPGEAEPDPG
ncbi:MAG: hypothetical protein R3F61_32635 [Myxococcota bacterium]